MREILQFYLGQSGVQIAQQSWELYCLEHLIKQDGTTNNINSNQNASNLQVLFSGSPYKRYTPRAAIFDDDQTTLDQIKLGPLKGLFHPKMIQQKTNESGSIWYNSYKDANINIRLLFEESDSINGIIIYHSTSGGFGGGATSKLLEILENETAKTTRATISIYPSESLTDLPIIEPYNTILTLQKLNELSDFNILIQNSALYNVCQEQLEFEKPNYSNLNQMIAQAASSITQSLRFSGQKFVDIPEMNRNLVPLPNQQLLQFSYAPFLNIDKQNMKSINVEQITKMLFQKGGQYFNFDPLKNYYISSSLFYRGDIGLSELKDPIKLIKEHISFVENSPGSFQLSLSNNSPVNFNTSQFAKINKAACMLSNSIAPIKSLQDLIKRFKKLDSKKSFIHWFTGAGFEQGSFSEAVESVQSIISLYKDLKGTKEITPFQENQTITQKNTQSRTKNNNSIQSNKITQQQYQQQNEIEIQQSNNNSERIEQQDPDAFIPRQRKPQ